jgi:hypothetical protein
MSEAAYNFYTFYTYCMALLLETLDIKSGIAAINIALVVPFVLSLASRNM